MNRIEKLQKYLEDDPNDSFLRYALAIEYIGIEKFEDAKEIFEGLISSDPEYTATYYHLGKIYQQEGDADKAEAVYRKGIMLTQKRREQHQLAELQTALNNMLYEE